MSAVVASGSVVLEHELSAFESRTPRSRERFQRALHVFPGGAQVEKTKLADDSVRRCGRAPGPVTREEPCQS